jgi:DNA repair protein RadC
MQYGQTASSEQMTFLGEEHTTKPKQARIPIYRVTLVWEGKMPTYESRIRSSASAHTVLQEYLADTDREHFVILMLDQKNQVIGINTVSIGSLTASVMHPREVYKPAILSNCAALILGHNHPSGDPGQAHLKVAWLFRYSGQGIFPPEPL